MTQPLGFQTRNNKDCNSKYYEICQPIIAKLKALKIEIQTLSIAFGDKRTPLLAKLVIGLAVGYFLSPIDLFPDFIPIFGALDDIIIVPTLIWLTIQLLPQTVLHDSRQKAKDNPTKFSKNNWIFGSIFILIWVLTLITLFYILKSKNLLNF
jgi:uncharacterized membrane protein YkvA (DUF1232 family)